ncbi:non-catalytic subunit wuho [Seminavis robusta]|uniref:Non-catalytic subunit wuho n=1 Tax=Seminavis robusta TaxID=568900 RepID=A0A9N8H5X8_9STRA|nr:non-catalytic subunit wuho [Seminavis robusta]|eukprot:Sro32_g021150.1 non-catalytic subunit wuho (567) ;mRNA; f:160778-162478
MKQLVDCCPGGGILLALNDRAFLVVSSKNRLVELVLTKDKDNNSKDNSTKNKKDKDKTSQDENENDENPIQAVAVHQVHENGSDHFWCAVSRLDKTLAIYQYTCSSSTTTNTTTSENDKIETATPTTVHSCPKRVACIAFASVPSNSQSKDGGMLVLVTGDLTGDSWAWPLHSDTDKKEKPRLLLGHTASMLTGVHVSSSSSSSKNKNNKVLLTSDRDEKIRVSSFPQTTIIQGFLLGHSAYVSSMDMVPSSNSSAAGSNHHCVSCSGDGTVRLWDYQAMKQLASTSPSPQEGNKDGSDNHEMEEPTDGAAKQDPDGEDKDGTTEDAKRDKENDNTATNDDEAEQAKEENDNSQEQGSTSHRIPSRVAVSPNGKDIAVIYDQSKQLDILQIVQSKGNNNNNDGEESSFQLCLTQSIECKDQPLAIAFVQNNNDDEVDKKNTQQLIVTMKDPSYLQLYCQQQPSTDASNPAALFVPTTTTTMPSALRKLQELAQTSSIPMPDGVLEKDRQGQPTLGKRVETRGGAARSMQDMPWNNPKRIEIAKQRNKRHKRRRIEKTKASKKQNQS